MMMMMIKISSLLRFTFLPCLYLLLRNLPILSLEVSVQLFCFVLYFLYFIVLLFAVD